MSLNLKKIKVESKFERPAALEAGTYPGALVQIVGLGLQEQRPYKGESKPPKQMLRVTYELADEFMLDEEGNEDLTKPRWVSEDFSINSLDSDLATSTKRYNAIDPVMEADGDFTKLLGKPCLIVLSSEPSKKDPSIVYNNVKGVNAMRVKDAEKAPGLVNPSKVFDFYEPDYEVFQALPEWLQGIIKDGLDYSGSDLEALVDGGPSGEKPKKEVPNDSDSGGAEADSDDEDW